MAPVPGHLVEPGEGAVRPGLALSRRQVPLGQLEGPRRVVDGVRVLEPVPQGTPSTIDAREEPAMLAVPHHLLQERAPVARQTVAPLARHHPVQQGEGDGGAGGMLKALLLRPERLPPVIEVDEKAPVLAVDHARDEGFQDVTSQSAPRLGGEALLAWSVRRRVSSRHE